MKHGKYIKYTYSGDRQILGYYSHGKASGKWEIDVTEDFGLLGTKKAKSISYFKNGLQHGQHTIYMNGKLKEQGNYIEGKKDGAWKEDYDSDCQCFSEGRYKTGVKVGKWLNTIFYEKDEFNPISAWGDVAKFKNGYTTYFDEYGKFIKCTSPDGTSITEIKDYEQAYTIQEYQDFLSKYPNSKYSLEVKSKLDKLLAEKQKTENRARLVGKVKSGDFESIKEYYGQNSSLANLYRVVNGIEVNSSFHINSKDVNHASQSKEHKEKAECFKSILAKSKNPIASEAVKTWYGTDPSLLMGQIRCKYSSDKLLEINWGKKNYGDYHTNLYFYPNELAWKNYGSSYFIYSKGEQIDKVKGKWYDGYWNKNEEQRYALDYINLMRTSSIDYDGFANKLFSILKFSTDRYKKECLKLYLSKIENGYKIQPTKVHDELAMKDIYRSILLWELGETEKSINLIKTTSSVYKEYKKPQYQTQSGTWVDISAGKYLKRYIKKEINEKYSVELTNQKELFKLLKKV